MKISWVILTYNRASSVMKAIPHCMANAGYKWDEIIWVDNGSSAVERNSIESIFQNLDHVTKCFIPNNLGVAKGYNTGMALARGTHLVITGCDMMMPKDWLYHMARSFELVPEMGIVTIYAAPIASTKERIRGQPYNQGGVTYQPCLPIGRRMLPLDLQRRIGYFHEGFGMYGWDDVAWGERAERVCKEEGRLCLNLVNHVAEHLGTEGNVGYDHKDEHAYWNWKKEQVNDPAKAKLLAELRAAGHPKFNPY